MQPKSELTVITKANDLCTYIITVTDKSPKKFRFTLTGRLQNLALDVIENMHRANEVFIGRRGELCSSEIMNSPETPQSPAQSECGYQASAYEKRLDYQYSALTSLKVLGTVARIAREQGCILPKQYEQMTKQIYDCQNLLGAWINSDKKRYKP